MMEDPGFSKNPDLRDTDVPLRHPYATPNLKRAFVDKASAVTDKVRGALGLREEDTSADEDDGHPIYRRYSIPGDVEEEDCMARPPNTHTHSVKTSHFGSTNPGNAKKPGRRSYIPSVGH